MRSNRLFGFVASVVVAAGTACGGGSNNNVIAPISVSVSPISQQVMAGGTQQFKATVNNASNSAVTWSVVGSGTIDATGLYTAPITDQSQKTVTVTATSQADSTKFASASVTLLPISISISSGPLKLRPGQVHQFSATVKNSAQTAVIWTASAGTIDSSGRYIAPSLVTTQTTATVTVTLVSDITKSSSSAVTVLALNSLAISPRGPALAVGGNQQLTIVGTFSDGTKYDWTSESTWSSADPTVATVGSAGLVGATRLGVTSITASYGGITATTAVNVTNMVMGNGNLNGRYAFSLSHAGIRGQGFAVGSFVADGNGNITAGKQDSNAAVGNTPPGGLSITGSYSVYLDGRGTLTLTTAQSTDSYTFFLSNDGPPSTAGRFILSGAGSVEVGTFQLQNAAAFSTGLTGKYVLLLGGMDGTLLAGSSTFQNPQVIAGQFLASTSGGGGTIRGFMDSNDNGTFNGGALSPLALSGTYPAAVDSNGRGTVQIVPPSTISTLPAWNFAFYIVSANKVLLIQTDLQSTPPTVPALAGTAELQSQSSFSNADVTGKSYVFLLERSASSGLFGDAGQWIFNASNLLSGEMDINKLGTTVKVTLSGSTYGSVAANGRGTLTISSTPTAPSLSSVIFYLVSPAKMYVLEQDVKPNAGVAEQQSASLGLPTGTLSFNLSQLATNGFDVSFSGQFVTTGTSPTNLAGIADSNIANNCAAGSTTCVISQASSAVNGTLSVIDGFGRGNATLNMPSQSNSSYGFYVVSPTKMVVFGTPSSSASSYQAVDGMIESQ